MATRNAAALEGKSKNGVNSQRVKRAKVGGGGKDQIRIQYQIVRSRIGVSVKEEGKAGGAGHDARHSFRTRADKPNMSNSTDSRRRRPCEAGDDPLGVLASERLGSAPAETDWCARGDDDCEARRPRPPPPRPL
jgi:hypothetical protein